MLYLNRSRELLIKSFNLTTRHYTGPANKNVSAQNRIQFFTKLLDLRDTSETEKLLKENRLRSTLKEEEITNSFKFLLSIGATVKDVRYEINLLNLRDMNLLNRYEILLECGCPKVNAVHINNYLKIENKTELALKVSGIIPRSIDLQGRLAQMLNVKLERIKGPASLKTICWHILKLFYLQNGIMTFDEFDKLQEHYRSGRHRSCRASKDILELALHHIKMSKEKLKNNFYVLSADPKNVRKLLSMKQIGGVEIEEILRSHPSVTLVRYESLQKSISCIKEFGFSEEAVAKCFRVLSLAPETIYARLMNLNKVKELETMKDHPYVLTLILHSSIIAARTEYLQLLNVKCISFRVLTGPARKFLWYAQNGDIKTVIRECLSLLAKIFNKEKSDIRKQMRRHKYWLQISVPEVKETIDELQKAGFSLDDIYSNIHIVLYSPETIFGRLKILNETKEIDGINTMNLPQSTQLKMVLYAIEFDYHFTGDGVWENRKDVERHELTNIEVPDVGPKLKLKRILDRAK